MRAHRSSAVTVVVRWGSTILDVAHLSAPASFTLGEAAEAPWGFAVPASVLGSARVPLVRADPSSGEVTLVVPPRATGTLACAGHGEVTLSAWARASGALAFPDIDGAFAVSLPPGVSATVTFGELSFEIAEDAPLPRAAGLRRGVRPGRIAVLAALATLTFHGGGLAASAVWTPALGETPEPPLAVSQRYTLGVTFDAPVESDPGFDDPDPATQTGDDREIAYSRCGGDDGGSQGDPESAATGDRYGVAGPSDNADPHIARYASWPEATDWMMIGLSRSNTGGDPHAPIMPWGRDDSLGTDPTSAIGGMWGNDIRANRGSPGMGIGRRRICPSCGAEGRGRRLPSGAVSGGAVDTAPVPDLTAAATPSARRR